MYDEDAIVLADPSLKPKIYIDDVLQTTGFTINYALGTVTFNSSVTGTVKADYKYATTSYYVLKPKAGQILSIRTSEIQFSSDVIIHCPVIFEAWVNHPTYGMIPVPGSRIAYKNEKDFMIACNGGQGFIPAWGNFNKDVLVFPFDYARPKPLKSSQQVEIRVYTLGHQQLSGSFATGTFYVTSETEVV